MTAPAPLRRGWCPGALRPMQTGDGLLVRLRMTGGIVSAVHAGAIADCAEAFGNGLVDLTARANLQLRGVTEASLPPLLERLSGLHLLDPDPDGESVRNVIASPLAGLDPGAILDIRPIVRALEARLTADPALRGLPGKFGFLVDDGGQPGLGVVGMDVRFQAVAGPGGPSMQVALGGNAESACAVGCCLSDEVPDVAAALGRAFLTHRGTGPEAPRRMRDLLLSVDSAALAAGLSLQRRTGPAPALSGPTPILGAVSTSGLSFLGAGAPFGRLSADGLRRLADIATRFGIGELRLTPWRALLLPGVSPQAARIAKALLGRDFILEPDDPRRNVAACPGAPGCRNGSTSTQADAGALASLVRDLRPSGVALHVSGCAKGCARPQPTAVTFVGREGRYDLVLNGSAGDPPHRFGLTLADAETALRELGRGLVAA